MDFQGRQTTEPKAAQTLLPHGADNSYFAWEFVSHPNSWEVCAILNDDGRQKTKEVEEDGKTVRALMFEWLPVLKKWFHMPGVNGVGTGRKGTKRPNLDRAILKLAKEGWTRVPWNAFPGGYIVEFDGQRGVIYASVFMYPSVVGDGDKATLQWDWDHPESVASKKAIGYNDFRRSLVTRGIIPTLTRRTRKRVVDVAKNRAKRWHKFSHIPSVAERIENNALRLYHAKNLDAPTAKAT